ncbi:MAG: hypothetical protein A3J55_02735 [Candidatus Ryanbacteria bacterium RIFCSPHIGHO2_02_FULL_45_17b]|nr:MAG: hypothetical protein A3J55_02735 [Candidatus Ryanbacteria bacterium RIFCSPHIGHO2_02_FULL_45_17b]
MSKKRLEVFLEFLVFGVVFGVIEDIIAVRAATGTAITAETIFIVIGIAIPFAFLGEILVDQIDFVAMWERHLERKKQKK